jgi:hypothetical protein
MMTLFKPLFFICLVTIGNYVHAQHMLGILSGSADGPVGMFLNPAAIGGTAYKYCVPLMGFDGTVDNSLGTLNSLGKTISKLKNSKGSNTGIFNYSGNPKFSMVLPGADLRGPGFIYALSDQHTVAFTTRLRAFNQFYNFDKLLYNVVQKVPDQPSVQAQMKNFKWTAHVWNELGFSYGGVITEKNNNQVKIGLTINILLGAAYIGMSGNSLDIDYKSGVDSFAANKADLKFSTSIAGSGSDVSGAQIAGKLLGGGGSGFGINAGVIWRCGKGEDKNGYPGYKIAVSISVTDLGSITYNHMSSTVIKGDGYIRPADLTSKIKDFGSLNAYLISRGYRSGSATRADIVYLPTTINAGADYNIGGRFYASLYGIFNVADDYNFGNKYYSQATLIARYDNSKLLIGVPLTLNTLTHNLRVGLGVKTKYFFVGSDDIALLLANRQYGFNIYFGGCISFKVKSKHSTA